MGWVGGRGEERGGWMGGSVLCVSLFSRSPAPAALLPSPTPDASLTRALGSETSPRRDPR